MYAQTDSPTWSLILKLRGPIVLFLASLLFGGAPDAISQEESQKRPSETHQKGQLGGEVASPAKAGKDSSSGTQPISGSKKATVDPGTKKNEKQKPVDPVVEKDRVGKLFPIPLGTAKERAIARKLYEKALVPAGRRYMAALQVKDPLERYVRTGDEKSIPDPRRGGRGNNDSDRITNNLLGWLLYGDEKARDNAVNLANWLVQIPDKQDHGHLQRHPAIGLTAIAARDGETRAALLNGFQVAFHRLQNSPFFQDDPENEKWMIGMGGVRPFVRAAGAAFRFSQVFEALVEQGYLTPEMLKEVPFTFETTQDFLAVVEGRLLQFCSWRKVAGDTSKRGWQTDPGEWVKTRDLITWPYLASRNPKGRYVTWFHLGCLWPYEMLVIETHSPGLAPLIKERTREIATFALEVGYDGGHSGMTGLNLKSTSGTFHPDNKKLWTAMRARTREDRLGGEAAYSLAPALYFAKAIVSARQRQLRRHLRVTKAVSYPGEVSWATLLVLATWSKGE